MSATKHLAVRTASSLTTRDDLSSDALRAQLIAARERARAQLDGIEARVGSFNKWREVVRRHPVAAFGGALLLGYVVARILRQRR